MNALAVTDKVCHFSETRPMQGNERYLLRKPLGGIVLGCSLLPPLTQTTHLKCHENTKQPVNKYIGVSNHVHKGN